MSPMKATLRRWARIAGREIYVLRLAATDPRVPWYARWLVVGIVAYALSPIDLIPDFIPVIGYLDDLVLLPLGVWLALRLIPVAVLGDLRRQAAAKADSNSSLSSIIAQ